MKSKSFTSKFVTFQEVDGVVTVGFADDEFNTNEYVLLQRTLQPDEQDRNLGLDGLHFQIDSPDQSGYDCIDDIHVTRSTIRITIKPELQSAFNCDEVKITFNVDDERHSSMVTHLKHVVYERATLTV